MTNPMPVTLGDHLDLYADLGFNIIPIQPTTKGDSRTGKQPILLDRTFLQWTAYQKRMSTLAERGQWWPTRSRGAPITGIGSQNVGVVTGNISNLIVLDIDDEVTYDELCAKIPELYDHFTVKSGRGYHIYMRPAVAGEYATRTFKLNGKTHHVKGEGGYVVGAPSTHYLDRQYTILTDYNGEGRDAPELRSQDILQLGQLILEAGADITKPETTSRNEPGWVEVLLSDVVNEGERHDAIVRIAGHLAHVFGPYREGEALAWLRLFNEARIIPPRPEVELDKAIAYALRKERNSAR